MSNKLINNRGQMELVQLIPSLACGSARRESPFSSPRYLYFVTYQIHRYIFSASVIDEDMCVF